MKKKINALLFLITFLVVFFLTNSKKENAIAKINKASEQIKVEKTRDNKTSDKFTILEVKENSSYGSRDEVASYIIKFNKLPKNYLSKKEATSLGWIAKEGNLREIKKDANIGGDIFRNLEGRLPNKKGRVWREADVNYKGGKRGPERLLYSSDRLIYYTKDHYDTFSLMYGGEKVEN